jgi:hypothetical protein
MEMCIKTNTVHLVSSMYLLLMWPLHVSATTCHPQGASLSSWWHVGAKICRSRISNKYIDETKCTVLVFMHNPAMHGTNIKNMEMFRLSSCFEFCGKRQLKIVDIYSDYIYTLLTAEIHQICHVISRCFASRPTHLSTMQKNTKYTKSLITLRPTPTLIFKHLKSITLFFKCSYFKTIFSYFLQGIFVSVTCKFQHQYLLTNVVRHSYLFEYTCGFRHLKIRSIKFWFACKCINILDSSVGILIRLSPGRLTDRCSVLGRDKRMTLGPNQPSVGGVTGPFSPHLNLLWCKANYGSLNKVKIKNEWIYNSTHSLSWRVL